MGFLFDANTGLTVTQFVGVWSDDVELPVGTGFYLQLPEAAPITFVGEVLQGDDSNKSVPAGLSIQGSTTPRSGTFPNLVSQLQLVIPSSCLTERPSVQPPSWVSGLLKNQHLLLAMHTSSTKQKLVTGTKISVSSNLRNKQLTKK